MFLTQLKIMVMFWILNGNILIKICIFFHLWMFLTLIKPPPPPVKKIAKNQKNLHHHSVTDISEFLFPAALRGGVKPFIFTIGECSYWEKRFFFPTTTLILLHIPVLPLINYMESRECGDFPNTTQGMFSRPWISLSQGCGYISWTTL